MNNAGSFRRTQMQGALGGTAQARIPDQHIHSLCVCVSVPTLVSHFHFFLLGQLLNRRRSAYNRPAFVSLLM